MQSSMNSSDRFRVMRNERMIGRSFSDLKLHKALYVPLRYWDTDHWLLAQN